MQLVSIPGRSSWLVSRSESTGNASTYETTGNISASHHLQSHQHNQKCYYFYFTCALSSCTSKYVVVVVVFVEHVGSALLCSRDALARRIEYHNIYSIGSYLYGPPLSDCAERFAAMYKQSRVAAEQDRFIRNLLQPSNHHITRSIYSHDGPRKRQTQLDGFPL